MTLEGLVLQQKGVALQHRLDLGGKFGHGDAVLSPPILGKIALLTQSRLAPSPSGRYTKVQPFLMCPSRPLSSSMKPLAFLAMVSFLIVAA
ncbi:hypothetical protein GCM10007972_11110 [Iodidimonas muriae]|uniref:Uncharacterized protein n=1 Tax=Iodidimonas muriae TaxID=261467 RepID=A0ABQ2LBS3_9PROT|nr:hypothetical protein JCM17843_12170 [Kordiimonadales bacterium JCM 17843]GGO09517.1 hypothetical protein GCM10007972_11110 [Iodidimonas muriae]